MPYRNSAIGGGGTLVIPQLKSPDFAFAPSPSYDVTGWKIQNNPSEVYAETFYGESMRVPTRNTVTGKYYDVADYLGLLSKYSRADKATSNTTVTLNTVAQRLFMTLDFDTITPSQTPGADSFAVYFDVTFIGDVQPLIAPSGNVVHRLQVTEYIDDTLSVGPTIVANPQAVNVFSALGNRAPAIQKWRIGSVSNSNYSPLKTTNRIIFDIVGTCSVANGARTNPTNTSLSIQQGITITYNG